MKAQMVEVNVHSYFLGPVNVPFVGQRLKFRSYDGSDFKSVKTNQQGKVKFLLLPTNSIDMEYEIPFSGGGTLHRRIYINYSERRPGHPHNHKKLDIVMAFRGE